MSLSTLKKPKCCRKLFEGEANEMNVKPASTVDSDENKKTGPELLEIELCSGKEKLISTTETPKNNEEIKILLSPATSDQRWINNPEWTWEKCSPNTAPECYFRLRLRKNFIPSKNDHALTHAATPPASGHVRVNVENF